MKLYYYRFPTYFFGFDGYVYFAHTKQFTKEETGELIRNKDSDKAIEALFNAGFKRIVWEGEGNGE